MLASSEAFSGFSTNDIPAARAFYAETLGLDVVEEHGMLGLRFAGGGQAMVYPKDDHVPATFTVLNFPVEDIDATVDALVARDVEPLRYPDLPQDERGIMRGRESGMGPDIAWFTDPAGNVLAVLQGDEG